MTPNGPDLTKGIPLSNVPDGATLLGHAYGEPALLVRRGNEVFAIGAFCTHYGAALADGLLVDDTVRCPWHHACFSLRTGDALRAPALDPVPSWRVEQRDGTVFVTEKIERAELRAKRVNADMPESVVIIGGGSAGNAAAERGSAPAVGGQSRLAAPGFELGYAWGAITGEPAETAGS